MLPISQIIRPPRIKKITAVAVTMIVLYTLAGFFLLPVIAKSVLTGKVSRALNRPIDIQQIKTNPYTLSMRLTGLRITDLDGETFFSLDDFFVNFQLLSIVKRAAVIRELALVRPFVRIVRNPGNSFNFSDIGGSGEENGGETGKAPGFLLRDLRISQGRLIIEDRTVDRRHDLAGIDFSLPFLSSFPKDAASDVTLDLRATLNSAPVAVSASLKPFAADRRGELKVHVGPSDIRPYLAYLSVPPDVIIKKGFLKLETTIAYLEKNGQDKRLSVAGPIVLSQLNVMDKADTPVLQIPELTVVLAPSNLLSRRLRIQQLALRSLELVDSETRNPLADIPLFTVADARIDLAEKTVKIGRLMSENGSIFCQRFKDGSLNLQHLVATGPAEPDLSKPAEEQEAEDNAADWHLTAEEIRLSDYALSYEDLSTDQPVQLSLDQITIAAAPFTTADGEKSKVSATVRWNQAGKISTEGTISVKPVAADLAVKASGIDIPSFQPYVEKQLNAVITDGAVLADGKIAFNIDAGGRPHFSYQGEAAIVDFASKDKDFSRDFASWASLHLSGITTGVNPNKLIVEKMAVSKYFTRVVINPDGTVNFNRVIGGGKKPESEPAAVEQSDEEQEKAKTEIRIGQMTFQDSSLQFTDLLNKPNFEANILKLGGSITGLSSEKGTVAEVFLKGVEENTAPMEIRGRMNPFGEERNFNFKLMFNDIELSPFSAYSGKYIGYLVQKGKLHVNLEYEMLGNTLQAKNLIVVDQLTLGDKVESPDAPSLPVAFAIALLKDRNGRIEIDLPVRGNVKDPEFKIGKIVLRMIGNLVTEIVTSPFAALGALFGGGEELSFVDFPPGSSTLTGASKEKLDALTKALHERPALQMEIQGEVDPQKDRDSLRALRFETLLQLGKQKKSATGEGDSEKAADIAVSPEEHAMNVKRAYAVSKIPKPKDAEGEIKELSVEEMEKLLLTAIRVNDGELRLLAYGRASRVKDYLLKDEKVDAGRVFIVEPGTDFSDKSPVHQKSRANFTLK